MVPPDILLYLFWNAFCFVHIFLRFSFEIWIKQTQARKIYIIEYPQMTSWIETIILQIVVKTYS